MTPGKVHSVAVKSNGEYGFDPEVWAGMPVKTTTPGSYEVIKGLPMDDFAKTEDRRDEQGAGGGAGTVKDMLK